jgi:hypothetical protein
MIVIITNVGERLEKRTTGHETNGGKDSSDTEDGRTGGTMLTMDSNQGWRGTNGAHRGWSVAQRMHSRSLGNMVAEKRDEAEDHPWCPPGRVAITRLHSVKVNWKASSNRTHALGVSEIGTLLAPRTR